MESFFSNIQSTGVFVLVLSILIVVHEWGHFITAKRLGIKVDEFALGFGPTLFSKFFNGTTYLLKAFPLGGYVKMQGDERSACTGKSDEFYSKAPGKRALVILNGPLVNFVFAYVSFVLVFILGYPGGSTKIAEIIDGGPAQHAGLQMGDKIIEVDGYRVYGWMNLQTRLQGDDSKDIEIKFLRNEQEITKIITPDIVSKPNVLGRLRDVRDIGIGSLSNTVGGVSKGYPAEEAGLKEGDRIVEIDGKRIYDWSSLQETVSHSKNETIIIKLLRDGKELVKAIKPKIVEVKDEFGEMVEVRKIGIGPAQSQELFRFGFVESFQKGWDELSFITVLTYESLFRMVTGAMSAKESVTGPVGIFYIVKGAAEAGFSHILFILGLISASLAIFNLLPVIPLDGGHLFLLAIEKIRGKALPEKVDEYIARAGFGLIMLLALFVFYTDFARFGWIDGIKGIFF